MNKIINQRESEEKNLWKINTESDKQGINLDLIYQLNYLIFAKVIETSGIYLGHIGRVGQVLIGKLSDF